MVIPKTDIEPQIQVSFQVSFAGFSFAGCGFDSLLLDPKGQAPSLFDDIGGENDIGGDLGDLAADQGAAFPEFGKAMGFTDDEANEAIRLSWCHLTPEVE